MSARDVRDLLDRLAEQAPDPATVFDAALTARIRRRRRARSAVAATGVTLAAAATVGAIAVGQFGWLSTGDGEGTTPATRPGVTLGGCGSQISSAPASGLLLEMTADLPSTAAASAEGYVRGTATVTNRSQETIRGVTARRPEITVSKDGIVVATPMATRDAGKAIDLVPGAAKAYELIVNVRACSREFASEDGSLPPGRYTLYGQLSIWVRDRAGRAVDERSTVQGGPWEIVLR